jgi:hypothetical protein
MDFVFGRGDDDHPFWLLTVRINILVFLICAALVLRRRLSRHQVARMSSAEWRTLAIVTLLAAALRLLVVPSNLVDFGGIPYSRLLYGYKGYFATAQFFSPVYQLTTRSIEHGIFLQRLAATLTIPLVYRLCRCFGAKRFAAIAAFLFAVYPLHILFSASDALAVFTTFLAAAAYLLIAGAVTSADRSAARLLYLGGFAGLALLTQVRPENVLLLIPVALYLFIRRRALRLGEWVGPLAVTAVFSIVYGYQAWVSGLTHQSPIDAQRGFDLAIQHLALNPFFAIPVLLFPTVAIAFYHGVGLALLAMAPWAAALALCTVTVEDGHGAARIFANWLILILPCAAYGLSLMLGAPLRAVRFLAVLALVYLAALPVLTGDRLTAQHAEIIENDRFRALLDSPPPGTDRIIVPDDELMWRQYHTTLEVYRKYAAILAGLPQAAQRLQLMKLTDYLSDPRSAACAAGRCVFFFGLPCMEQPIYAVTRQQCETMLRSRRMTVVDDTEVVAGPFVACSIYSGGWKRRFCDPATAPRSFRVYRIEGQSGDT